VVVIGAAITGNDCVRTAIRQGALGKMPLPRRAIVGQYALAASAKFKNAKKKVWSSNAQRAPELWRDSCDWPDGAKSRLGATVNASDWQSPE